LNGQAISAAVNTVFGQDGAADMLRPGPLLAALTARAASRADSLTDNELIGVLQASRRLANLAAYQQTVVIAEFARRRQAEFEAAKAAALELKLAPDAVQARKELARHLDQRVEARREESGNASLSGRELSTADVIASKAHIDAIAVKLRDSGLVSGTLASLRALALVDLTQGRDPLERIKPQPGGEALVESSGHCPESFVDPDASEPAASQPGDPRAGTGPARPGDPAPVPALINLLVPAGTLLGWGAAPAQAAGWGLLDADETRALVRAASRHPGTRWCATIIAPDGTAIAHGCAKGRRPWPPDTPGRPDDPPPVRAVQLLRLLQRLKLTLEPIARDACDHRHAEGRYVPSRKLRHLLRARNQTCTAPACNAQAQYCDIDHTVPYPDGPTDQCNTNPKCRRHHRTKQAPGWQTAQPAPDTATWTTPSGRVHTTGPTAYDV
jgi:hypothetical protein